MKRWTPLEDALIREFWPTAESSVIRSKFRYRSYAAVKSRAFVLKVKRIYPVRTKEVMNKHPIIQSLIRRREELKYSRNKLAKVVGYADRTIAHLEAQHSTPSWTCLHNWCEALDMELIVRPRAISHDWESINV